jgi:hypothetical protein
LLGGCCFLQQGARVLRPARGVLDAAREGLKAAFDALNVTCAVFFSNPMMLFGA